MEKRKTKCESCSGPFSYTKDKGYMVVFGNCNHSLCLECFGQATRTHGSVACFVKACNRLSSLCDLVKVNCATRKMSCVFCSEVLDAWCMELSCKHLVCMNCSKMSKECSLCSQKDDLSNRKPVFIRNQEIIRNGFVQDTEKDIACQFCKVNKGEVELRLCGHVVCQPCLKRTNKNSNNIECPLYHLCQSQYPIDELKPFQNKEIPMSIFGMPSVGLTCYASCILQVLRHTELFVQFLERHAPNKDSFVDLLLDILTKDSAQEARKHFILQLLGFLHSIDGTFDQNNQNDCVSFLHVLLDVLSKDDSVKGKVDHFFIDVVDEIECKECMTKQETCEQRVLGINAFTDISENFNMGNLYGEELFENRELECTNCGKSKKLVKTSRMANCPALLMFQIQRIWETADGFVKRNCEIKFSQRLHLEIKRGERIYEMPKYELYAVVYHSGDLEGGHYYSAVKHDNQWYICDNDQIWKCQEEDEILKFRDVYLLFYERK